MQAVHVFARTSSEAEMVQANPALQEAVAVMRRTGWLDADSRPSAYAIEQLVSIADRCHAQSGQEPAVEIPRHFISAAAVGSRIFGETMPLHRGRRTMVWQTRVTTADGKLIAIVTQTQLVFRNN